METATCTFSAVPHKFLEYLWKYRIVSKCYPGQSFCQQMEHMFLQHSGNWVGVRLHPISQLGSLVFPCDCEPPSCFWQDTNSCGPDRHLVTEFPIMEKLHLIVSDLKYGLHLNSTAIAKQFAYEVAGQSRQKTSQKFRKSLLMHLYLSSKGLKCL